MYMRARKLQEISGGPHDMISLNDDQMESYLLAINSLSLLEEKKAWFIVQTFVNNAHESEVSWLQFHHILPVSKTRLKPRKRRKLIRNLPSSNTNTGPEIIDLSALRFDYTLLSAKQRLIRRDSTLLSAPG